MPDSQRDLAPAAFAAAAPQPVRLADYRAPDFLVDRVALTFVLDATRTIVRSRLALRRNPAAP
ncbi:MAG: hypothetical protein JO047_16785, partial [Alphaproteobacteria bacterium]|nr:hypothetical protein [Alphaproteobacteria bacterium]